MEWLEYGNRAERAWYAASGIRRMEVAPRIGVHQNTHHQHSQRGTEAAHYLIRPFGGVRQFIFRLFFRKISPTPTWQVYSPDLQLRGCVGLFRFSFSCPHCARFAARGCVEDIIVLCCFPVSLTICARMLWLWTVIT